MSVVKDVLSGFKIEKLEIVDITILRIIFDMPFFYCLIVILLY